MITRDRTVSNQFQFCERRLLTPSVLTLSLMVAAGHASSQVDLRVVMATGDAAPHAPGETVNNIVWLPGINNQGQMIVSGVVSGNGLSGTNNQRVWLYTDGEPSIVLRNGDPAVGFGAELTFGTFYEPVLADHGVVAVPGLLRGPGVNTGTDDALWISESGDLELLFREGASPDSLEPGEVIRTPTDVRVNEHGDVAFFARLSPGSMASIWRHSDGELELVARRDGSATGTSDTFVGADSPVINRNGLVAFRGFTPTASGCWTGTPDSLNLVALSGTPAPALGPGSNLGTVGAPAINDAGQIVVHTTPIPAVWRADAGSLQLIAAQGMPSPIPDTEYDGVLQIFGQKGVINQAGEVAFQASVSGVGINSLNNEGIFVGTPGSVRVASRDGDLVPDATDDAQFANSPSGQPHINARGMIAFAQQLTGGTVTGSNNFGLYAEDFDGVLRRVLRKGDVIDIDRSPNSEALRTVQSIQVAPGNGGEDGRLRAFNEWGQLVFLTSFVEGGEAVIVATLPGRCLADTNANGVADPGDFTAWVAAYNLRSPAADQNGNGAVEPGDFSAWVANYNFGCP